MQRQEFAVRSEVKTAESILHAMYVMNPIILRQSDTIGRLAPGVIDDVAFTTINPLENISGLAEYDAVTQVVEPNVPV